MSEQINKTYNPKEVEDRLYNRWVENGYFTRTGTDSAEYADAYTMAKYKGFVTEDYKLQYNIKLKVGQDKVELGGITAAEWGEPVDGGLLETL